MSIRQISDQPATTQQFTSTFAGPNGWKYGHRMEDEKALEKVKAGDKLELPGLKR